MATPLDVCFVSPGLPHDGSTLKSKSLGGSETMAIRVARGLAKRGHFVTVFSQGAGPGIYDGVTYMPIEQAVPYLQSTPHDVTIISRALELVPVPYASKLRILWCHDLSLKRQRQAFSQGLWNIDAVYVMSEFQRKQYVTVHAGIPDSFFVTTRNGVDLEEFAPLHKLKRDPRKLVYGSRPERGLETCLQVMTELANRGSDLRLHIAAYDNAVPHLAGYVGSLLERAKALPNVHVLGALTQSAWQRELATARAMLYPGPPSHSGFGVFREISCIAAIEAMACGTPVIGCHKGAVPETIGDGGSVLLGDEDTDCQSAAHINGIADAAMRLRTDDHLWESFHDAALRRAQSWSVDGIAAQWEADWHERLTRQCSDPKRLALHFQRTGDREAMGE